MESNPGGAIGRVSLNETDSAGRLKGRLGNSNPVLIRHDYKRACYRAMLSEFTVEEIVDFWNTIPLIIDGRQIKSAELFQLLWSDKEKIPMWWDSETDNLIEAFLIDKKRDVQKILNKILWLNNQSTYIPGKVLLTWFYPKLETLFDSIDTRDMVFALIALFTENYLPGHIHRRVKRWEEGEWVKSVQVFISGTTFAEFVDWDYEFIAKPQIMNGPVMFGMPAFEDFGMISDTRLPEGIVWEKDAGAVRENGVFSIRGEVYGTSVPFADFCKRRDIDLTKFGPPNLETLVMDRDYFCPIRNRIVLHKDCAYGAPVFLNWVSHRKLNVQSKGLLNNIILDIQREEAFSSDELEKRHKELIAFVAGRADFVYHAADESMTLNGQYFTKNVPAKIMKYLLESHLQKGQSEFQYRELKRLFEISQGQKNSNFEVRFYRLVDKLKEECSTMWVEKTGRGRFSLVVNGPVEFKEA